jgi:glycerophosphoryl diester phosphodiesterase
VARRPKIRPTIIAHRGASGLAPESTLAAFEKAIEVGADGIEFDVHLTADGQVVVHHDYCINKEWARFGGVWLGETGPAIRDLTLSEVQSYDMGRLAPGSEYQAKYPEYVPADGACIPTLQQVLDLVSERAPPGFQLWLELKLSPPDQAPTSDAIALADATLAILASAGMMDQTIMISFYWPALYHVQRQVPRMKTGFLSVQQPGNDTIQAGQPDISPWTAPLNADDHGGSVPAVIKAAGGDTWSVSWSDLTQDRLAEARRLGLSIGVWTIRHRDEGEVVKALGVDVITTDRPDWFIPANFPEASQALSGTSQ